MDYLNSKPKYRIKKIFNLIVVLILILFSFGAGLYAANFNKPLSKLADKEVLYVGKILNKYQETPEGKLTQNLNFDLYWQVWDVLENKHLKEKDVNDQQLFYGSLKGMAKSLDDPYTTFMDPELAKKFSEDLAGEFEGIGAEIGIRNNTLTVIAPLEGMPAQKAGLKAGDKVYAINGETTANITIDEAVSKIRGEKGTEVTLTIYRENLEETKDIAITRGIITVKSVHTDYKPEEDIYIIEISNFNEDTLGLFDEAIKDIQSKEVDSVILDLRNNPGGYLQSSIAISSEWVEDGPIVIEKFEQGQEKEYKAQGRPRLKDYSTVILVNQGSASASEIVAGALKDYDKATIVGKKTFGKGSVQTLQEFYDGSALKYTVAEWLTPEKNSINKQGISPDIEVDYTLEDVEAEKDPQMEKALEILKQE